MKRVAIIGGGIAGLSAAYYLQQAQRSGADIRFTLHEASARLGGVIRSERVDGCLIEAGPDSFLSAKPWAAEMCRELGLGDQLIGSEDAGRKTYILKRGRLVAMPQGLQMMVPTRVLPIATSPLFSWRTKLALAREYLHSGHFKAIAAERGKAQSDESVATFIARHFGAEMVTGLADPLLAGVYGGEAATLSLRAVMPSFAELESTYGSLSRGMLAGMRRRAGEKSAALPLFTTLRGGMQQMVDALADSLFAGSVSLDDKVQSLRREGSGWMLRSLKSSSPEIRYDCVVLATPAYVASALLGSEVSAGELAANLGKIPYSSSVTVSLGFARAALKPGGAQLPGFGFLVPRAEGKRMLACTFVGNKFAGRVPPDKVVLRMFMGGSRDPEVLSLSDDELLAIVRQELGEILGIGIGSGSAPEFRRIYRWARSMPLYEVGHLERVAEIERLAAGLPGLFLTGNSLRGVGVPDCVRSGKEVAAGIASLASAAPAASL